MPPAATVGLQTPSSFSFDPSTNNENDNNQNPNGNESSNFNFNFSTGFSSSSSSNPTFPRPSSSTSTRSKPRFFKQKRSSTSKYSSFSSAPLDPGINPFRSLNNNNNNNNTNSNNFVIDSVNSNMGFVFRGLNSNGFCSNNDNSINNGVKINVGITADLGKNETFQKEEEIRVSDHDAGKPGFDGNERKCNGAQSGPFEFGATNEKSGEKEEESELSDGLKKLNIENNSEKGKENSAEDVRDEVKVFIFKSGGGDSVPLKCEVNGGTNLDENIFVFGSSGNSTKAGGSSSQGSGFGVDGVKGDVPSSTFPSWSFGGNNKPEDCSATSGERTADCSSPGLSERAEVFSSSEFKLPDLDPSLSFSANLFSGVGRKTEGGVGTRVSRDKKTKKNKGKSRQSKPTKQQPLQTPVSRQSAPQDQDASGCYSPMDFSPYEDDSSNNDVPLSGHIPADQADVKTGNSSAPFAQSQPSPVFMSSGAGAASTVSTAGFSSNMSHHDGDAAQFPFSSKVYSTAEEKFASAASSSGQQRVSSVKRQPRKYKLKTAYVSGIQGSSLGSNTLHSTLRGQGAKFSVSENKGKPQTEADEEQECDSTMSAAEKACDKWRRRGNEAYEKGELSKAEEFYTWGVNSIPPGDASGVVFRPLVRCYSNRAASRMALGRVREAIQDCLMAVKLDPTFHRAQMRAANCHLLLGEAEDAMHCFSKSMDSANVICLDRQIIISASEGIQKSQKVIECINRSAELLKLRSSEAAASALESIAEALAISSYSEKLLEMKAEALCVLQKYEEAITLCQQTLGVAEKNFPGATHGKLEIDNSCLNVRLWRHRILSKCYFHLGKLEVALDLLEKQEFASESQESPDPLAVTIHELLKQKTAGNTAFKSGKHAEAIEHYTSAILSSMDCRPFAAICFCNRAAAHQALGQITDAIADCSLAIALDENYAKAVSRRATLHEMIRDYKQAAADLQRLASILEKQSHETSKQSGSGNGKELRQVQLRLSMMEEEAKRDVPLDLYLILGIKKTDSASEIKKAYRKAALRHHPDKACQSLVRSDAGDEGRPWKDITELVHRDSDRLFKIIGEAYAVLSDPTKREEYDHGEDMRKALKECNNVRRSSRRQSEYYSHGYPFERSSSRRYWHEYGSYSNSHRRW